MPSELTHQKQQMVGIFWLIEDRLVLDTTLLSEAEPYGDCLTHGKSHIDFWTEQQALGTVPHDIEYEEYPRGRVVYNVKTERFTLYADRCILARKSLVGEMKKTMHLPTAQTDVMTDGPLGHYRCYRCWTVRTRVKREGNSES
jgi:hypothetical protein